MTSATTGYDYSLSNAISAYHAYVDVTSKLFTYLQIVAAAAAGFSWSSALASTPVLITTLLVYVTFATGNLFLVIDAHGRAARASAAIMHFWRHDAGSRVEPHFRELSSIYRSMKTWQLVTIHAFVDTFAAGAIVWRLFATTGRL